MHRTGFKAGLMFIAISIGLIALLDEIRVV
jgi:hypothetical protein